MTPASPIKLGLSYFRVEKSKFKKKTEELSLKIEEEKKDIVEDFK